MTNPLLNFKLPPHFDSIKAEHVLPALESVLNESRTCIAELESLPQPSWQNFAAQMEKLEERLDRVWSPVSHLNAVADSAELRTAYQNGIEMLSAYSSELSQNKKLFKQYTRIKASDDWHNLNTAEQKLIENCLLDFRLGGAHLDQKQQAKLTKIDQQLSKISNQFQANLLDSTQAWSLLISNDAQLKGLPQSAMDMARQLAHDDQQEGWLFNLQAPSYLAVMQFAEDDDLRKKMYQAYACRASELSDNGKFDNAQLIERILELRQAKAELLEFSNFAELSMVKKMASSSNMVLEFLRDLAGYAKPIAKRELEELEQFARTHYQREHLEPWDISFFSERLREHRYSFNDEQLKPYFPAPQVLEGLFKIATRLFGIRVQSSDSFQVWNTDVMCFDVLETDSDTLIGSFFVDLYVRKNKRGGAWMGSCIHRQRNQQGLQTPIAFLTCNFTPPIGDSPALLTHDEVETLFHEFGHTLHHILTKVDVMSVGGINGVAWDAVELPSQFLENWCWDHQSLDLIAGHHQTGEALPDDLLFKMRSAKNFQAGMQTLRQIEFAMFDMLLHAVDTPPNVQALLDQVREEIAVIPAPDYNRFQNSFAHIFAGGYAAGYYSYKWSEVLSADAFGRFEEEGIFNSNTGRDFLRSILERGGVDDPNDLFLEFRGRPPQIQALLRQSGLISQINT